MIELLPETKGSLIAVKMSGTISEADFDKYFPIAEAILEQEKVEHMLFDWEDLDGWEKGARSTGTWFGMHHRALISRVAVIAPERWDDEVLRITDIFHPAAVRRFRPSERQHAFDWIRQG